MRWTELEEYVTTTHSIGGWMAVLVVVGDDGPEPWSTGVGRYVTREDAEREAKAWARDEGIEYRPGGAP